MAVRSGFSHDSGDVWFQIVHCAIQREMRNMVIKVLGPGCSKCRQTEKVVKDAVAESGVSADVEKVTDILKIAEYGVFGTPAVVVNGEVKSVGKIPTKDDVLKWIKKEANMEHSKLPRWYAHIRDKYPQFANALENLGETVRKEGPLDQKTSHLIQLAAAAAIRSEGSVHSHARRAMQAGATAEEIYHAVLLLTSTIGFPATSAALSWVYGVLNLESENQE